MELELKLRLPDEGTAERVLHDPELLRLSPEGQRAIPMAAVYYDTADGALEPIQYTFRLRREGDRSVVTLKSPSEGEGALQRRGEWEAECGDIARAVPCLAEAGAPAEVLRLLEGKPLLPRAEISFLRRCLTLRLEGGTVELAVDKGSIHAGGRSLPLHELELELISGPPEVLTGFAAWFQARHPLEAEPVSKYGRAAALLCGEAGA